MYMYMYVVGLFQDSKYDVSIKSYSNYCTKNGGSLPDISKGCKPQGVHVCIWQRADIRDTVINFLSKNWSPEVFLHKGFLLITHSRFVPL